MYQDEHFFICPYCGARISVMLDLSIESQDYTEDCEVCCQPIEIHYEVQEGEVAEFDARRAD